MKPTPEDERIEHLHSIQEEHLDRPTTPGEWCLIAISASTLVGVIAWAFYMICH